MEFTKENWETAPEGARLEWLVDSKLCVKVDLIGFMKDGIPVIEDQRQVRVTVQERLRIILPKREVTVQLWQSSKTGELEATFIMDRITGGDEWTLLAEHTFEVEGE